MIHILYSSAGLSKQLNNSFPRQFNDVFVQELPDVNAVSLLMEKYKLDTLYRHPGNTSLCLSPTTSIIGVPDGDACALPSGGWRRRERLEDILAGHFAALSV